MCLKGCVVKTVRRFAFLVRVKARDGFLFARASCAQHSLNPSAVVHDCNVYLNPKIGRVECDINKKFPNFQKRAKMGPQARSGSFLKIGW